MNQESPKLLIIIFCVVGLPVLLFFFLFPFWLHAQSCVWLGEYWGSFAMSFLIFAVNPRSRYYSFPQFCFGVVFFAAILLLLSFLTVPLFSPVLF